ncbi:MAG: 50S ribosomal protein L24 [Anaerolineae bacterium]|jgi:large subunit ribosomal protein L24
MNRIKKGDVVEVITGEDKDIRGEVVRVLDKGSRIVVSKVNMVTKHQSAQRAGRSQMQGGRIQFEAPIDVSNVLLVCPKCDEATRVGYDVVDERKVRVCRKCDAVIE